MFVNCLLHILITDRFRRMRGRLYFHRHLSVNRRVPHLHPIILPLVPCPFLGEGWVPWQGQVPCPFLEGVSWPGQVQCPLAGGGGGTPSQVRTGQDGVPPSRSGQGGTSARWGWGNSPQARSGWGTPSLARTGMAYPLARSAWTTHTGQGWGTPGQVRMGYSPPPPPPCRTSHGLYMLRSVRLLRFPAGGLSSWHIFPFVSLTKI